MIDVLDAQTVREAERDAMSRGVTEMFLRLNAALAVADGIFERAKRTRSAVAVFCGTGGNGCDGLLAACRLHRLGNRVEVYVVGDERKLDKNVLAFASNEGVKVLPSADYHGGAGIIIDAIFGIGLNRPITGETAELIDKLNAENDAFRLAIDIPSGLNADTGEIMGTAFCAHVTLTFSCYKIGMLFANGRDVCGRMIVEDIGVKTSSVVKVFDDSDFRPFERAASAHKGTAGRIFIIGGCGSMIGAPLMAGAAAHAAYLNGAGTVTVCLPNVHRTSAAARATMAMLTFMSDTAEGFIKFDKHALDGIIEKAVAIDIGMGMGDNPELKRIVEYLADNFNGALVIDADALNAIKRDYMFLKNAKAKIILTPHVGEFERLTGKPASVKNAVELARELGCVVALKSSTTIITDGKQMRLNITGTPAMAKGGMGDVLGGCITALACAYSPIDAVSVACYRNGLGAERAVSSYAQMMLTPRDVLNYADYDET